MRALIGLGNPGRRYQMTRHNAGFLFLDYLNSKYNIPFRPGKGDYYFSEVSFGQHEVVLIKPTTYMNNSGLAVRQVMEHFSILQEDLLIIYDDFHLPFGTLRFRAKGSDAGHNGIKSIIYELESELFSRLKIGIGSAFSDAVDFVLADFSEKETERLGTLFKTALHGVESWIEYGIDRAMNLYNRNLDSTETN